MNTCMFSGYNPNSPKKKGGEKRRVLNITVTPQHEMYMKVDSNVSHINNKISA